MRRANTGDQQLATCSSDLRYQRGYVSGIQPAVLQPVVLLRPDRLSSHAPEVRLIRRGGAPPPSRKRPARLFTGERRLVRNVYRCAADPRDARHDHYSADDETRSTLRS
jgi:hypothetical protein